MPDDGQFRPIDLTSVPRTLWQAMGAGVFTDLTVGDRLEITCQSDPTAIRDLLEAILPGRFDWEFVRVGAAGWCVRVTRRAGCSGSARSSDWTRGRPRIDALQIEPAA